MDGTPKVSVIIATFNRAAFLSETLDSVMRQKFEEFEVIVVDDGSTDDTKEVVRLVDLFEKSIVRLQAALISKSSYDAVGGHDENLRICMDLDLSFRLLMNYPVAYIDRVVFLYRKHEGNIGRNEELRLLENIRVIEKLIREFPQAEKQLGCGRIARRMAYRSYRL